MRLLALLCLGLVAALGYGYRLYAERGAALDAMQQSLAGLPVAEQELRQAREEIARLQTAVVDDRVAGAAAADDRLHREIEALRLKLEHAEHTAAERATELEAARERIAALEAELSGSAVTPAAQPADERSPEQLLLELRLVERERDAARTQLDETLQRLTALKKDIEPVAGASSEGARRLTAALARIEQLDAELKLARRQLAELEAARQP